MTSAETSEHHPKCSCPDCVSNRLTRVKGLHWQNSTRYRNSHKTVWVALILVVLLAAGVFVFLPNSPAKPLVNSIAEKLPSVDTNSVAKPTTNYPKYPFPYGRYESSDIVGEMSITLNSNDTYVLNSVMGGKEYGTYKKVAANAITFIPENPGIRPYTQVFSYSAQSKCLYLGASQSSMRAYYKQLF